MDEKTRAELQQADIVDIDVNAQQHGAEPGRGAPAATGPAGKSDARARHKGQLGALVSLATERRSELEDKWTRNKKNMAAAGAKYGF